MKIGVLALQGDVEEHMRACERAASEEDEVLAVKKPEEISGLQALIIPGGESTTIGKLMQKYGIDKAIEKNTGLGIMGTCAGAILLAKEVENYSQFTLAKMDIVVKRNAYGRQVESFETDIEIPVLGGERFHAVFIRAPVITRFGRGVEVLAELDNNPVLVRQGRYVACTFHPELTQDTRIHRYFFEIARNAPSP